MGAVHRSAVPGTMQSPAKNWHLSLHEQRISLPKLCTVCSVAVQNSPVLGKITLKTPGFSSSETFAAASPSFFASRPGLRLLGVAVVHSAGRGLRIDPPLAAARILGDGSVTSALLKVTMFATRNKCIASSNKCLTSSNKKLLGTSASLLVTSALLVVTRSY